jgi:hypothetical protein
MKTTAVPRGGEPHGINAGLLVRIESDEATQTQAGSGLVRISD